MSTRAISYHTLVCDGCQTTFGNDVYYASVIEARAAAYAAGWRFPERIRASGGESKTVNDVCPKCEPGWERQPAPNNWAARRAKREASQ